MDKRWFIGIPSPTAAALVVGLVWVNHSYGALDHVKWLALLITLFAGLSMVVQIRFWSFKEFNVRRKVPFFTIILAYWVCWWWRCRHRWCYFCFSWHTVYRVT